jgi:hypothetical protein
MADHNHFNGVLRSLDASVVVQGRNICSFQTGMSLVRTVSTVYYPQNAQAFYTPWILSL